MDPVELIYQLSKVPDLLVSMLFCIPASAGAFLLGLSCRRP